MAIVAGIDEAGYGPLMGPLVITAVAFDVPNEKAYGSLWELLKDAVSIDSKEKRQRLVVRDSKKLYNARNGLKSLEEAVLSFLRIKDFRVASFCQLLSCLSCYDSSIMAHYPWYAERDCVLPLSASIPAILNYADLLQNTLEKQGVQLCLADSRVLTVQQFNEQVRMTGNKASVLFQNCAALISKLWNTCSGHIRLTVDKQGGRNRYFDLLRDAFPKADIKVLLESAEVSTYEIENAQKKMELAFTEKGEDHSMAAALASIFSKYIRELFMRLENQYWLQFLPNLRPTAGYYEDAQRFLAEIAPVKKKEGIMDDSLIRIK